jgi:hypothetical protein
MRWDQPVTELFPDFKLEDVATTKRVQDLICACTGDAAAGLGVAIGVPQRDAGFGDETPGLDATD